MDMHFLKWTSTREKPRYQDPTRWNRWDQLWNIVNPYTHAKYRRAKAGTLYEADLGLPHSDPRTW